MFYNLIKSLFSTQELNDFGQPTHLTKDTFPRFLVIFFNPVNFLVRLLQFLLIKRTLNFIVIIIVYFIRRWVCVLNFRHCKHFLSLSRRV